ncbi:hypothetical protein, partial [Mesorhizobium sp. M8A.F.Ca.ET.142.01.1.1]|uniref:hypothetical protein n=1 Tax=Mesorhizobium sp. M8A.F.Ca.ET.142.01.1.1 TaxID=2563958 RepID=UPI001AEE35CB
RKVYPNADRYAEDGWRLYSAYDPATRTPRASALWVRHIRLTAIVLAFVAAVLLVVVFSALPH